MSILKMFKSKEVKPPVENIASPVGWAYSKIYTDKNFKPYNEDILLVNKGSDIYRRMMCDDQVKAVMRFKQYSVISRGWFFDVDEENPMHGEISDFFSTMLEQVKGSFKDKLIIILSSLINGFSITEKHYGNIMFDSKPYWGVIDFRKLPFHTFTFVTDACGRVEKLLQEQGTEEVEINMDRVIHHVYQPDMDHLYGESDLKAAYRPYWSKDITIKFRNIHLERHATGFIYAVVSGNINSAQQNLLENFLNNVTARSSAWVPDNIKLEKFDAIRTDAYEKALVQDDKAIAKSILVPNLLGLSEQGSTGSYAQSKTQFDAFLSILDYEADRLAEVLNEQMFSELALWNFATEDYPRFRFDPMTKDMKGELAKQWTDLIKGGSVTKSKNDETYIRNLMGFPEKSEEENIEDQPEDIGMDNLDWLLDQPEEDIGFIKSEFKEKPWLRRVNFKRLENTLTTVDKAFGQDVADILADVRFNFESQIAKLAGERSLGYVKPKELESIKFPSTLESKLKKVIRQHTTDSLNKHYSYAKKEIPKKKFAKILPSAMDKLQREKFLSSIAMRLGGWLGTKLLGEVLQHLENGIRYDYTPTQAVNRLLDGGLASYLPEYEYFIRDGKEIRRAINIPARIENMVRTANSDAMNQARLAAFNDPELKGFVLALEYSAVMDDRTTAICQSLHGRIMKDFGAYYPPNHHSCRSICIPVTVVDNWDGKESTTPSIKPQKGFY